MSRKDLNLLNKSLREVADILAEADCTFRIVKRDGVQYMVTADHHADRCNLSLLNGKVEAFHWG